LGEPTAIIVFIPCPPPVQTVMPSGVRHSFPGSRMVRSFPFGEISARPAWAA